MSQLKWLWYLMSFLFNNSMRVASEQSCGLRVGFALRYYYFLCPDWVFVFTITERNDRKQQIFQFSFTIWVSKRFEVLISCSIFQQIDSYSAFYDNGGFQQTELHEALQSRGIQRVIAIGFAVDICVYSTCKDAIKLGTICGEQAVQLTVYGTNGFACNSYVPFIINKMLFT